MNITNRSSAGSVATVCPASYNVLTWDAVAQRFTPHDGLSVRSVVVSLRGVRAAIRELRSHGYSGHSDPGVIVVRSE